MVLDLDGFKEVNDTLGHGRGDELLQGIAERLRHALRDADLVARLGGDEFGVLLVPGRGGLDSYEALAERIRDALSTPFQLGDLWVEAGTSIGIACCPEHARDAETLVQRADVAMYLAKRSGAGHDVYDVDHDPDDRAIVESTVRLAASLGLEAIAEGVETSTAWQRLIDYGCPQAQGFHVCRPLDVHHLEAWLGERGGALV